jgi:hypothetical protein
MSLIPPDNSRGEGHTTPNAEDSERRAVDRLKTVAASLVATLAVAIERVVTGYARDGMSETDTSSALPDTVEEGALARYERPPVRAETELELVSTETDERLTVEAADNPDAAISSDTWVPIER